MPTNSIISNNSKAQCTRNEDNLSLIIKLINEANEQNFSQSSISIAGNLFDIYGPIQLWHSSSHHHTLRYNSHRHRWNSNEWNGITTAVSQGDFIAVRIIFHSPSIRKYPSHSSSREEFRLFSFYFN